MAAVFRAQSDTKTWKVASAGTRVGPGNASMCEVAADLAHLKNPRQRSKAVNTAVLRRQGLILTATAAERAAIAVAAPDLRARVFTLREAIFLGEGLTPPIDSAQERGLTQYALALHLRRGFVSPPRERRFRFFSRRHEAAPFDVADVHHLPDREHRIGLEKLITDITTLQGQLKRFLDGRDAHDAQG